MYNPGMTKVAIYNQYGIAVNLLDMNPGLVEEYSASLPSHLRLVVLTGTDFQYTELPQHLPTYEELIAAPLKKAAQQSES